MKGNIALYEKNLTTHYLYYNIIFVQTKFGAL